MKKMVTHSMGTHTDSKVSENKTLTKRHDTHTDVES